MRSVKLRILGGSALVAVSAMSLATPSAQKEQAIAEPASGQDSVQVAQAYSQPLYAPSAQSGWEQHKSRLAALARQQGVREATIQAVVPDLRPNQRVMELDRAQRPTSTSNYVQNFGPYLDRHITTSLINRGQARYSTHWSNLSRIQSQYGVEPSVIIAIYGKETSYGAVTGGFDLLEALASLAYEGRRRGFFEEEFISALKLMDQGVRRWQLKGSYAGATGYPQFMPSVALRLRSDGDGDGYADIWRNEDDAFASIANYLRDAGWKPNVPWGTAVRTPATLNRTAIRSRLTAQRCPRVFQRHSRWMTVAEWRALGVVPVGYTRLAQNELTALIEPDGPNATAYLLSNNYRAILDYNCSNYYALSVGLLADAIARR